MLILPILLSKLAHIMSDWIEAVEQHWWKAVFTDCHIFMSGLWLDHSKICRFLVLNHSSVALAVCIGSLICCKVNLHPSLASLASVWQNFSSTTVFACIHIALNHVQLPNPCQWKAFPQHHATSTMLHCGDGVFRVLYKVFYFYFVYIVKMIKMHKMQSYTVFLLHGGYSSDAVN